MRTTRLAAAVAVALTATSAIAADKGGAPPQPSVADILPVNTSCYVQALAGSSISTVKVPDATLPAEISASNWTITGGLGCDVRVERIVVGALARVEMPLDTEDLIKAERSWMIGGRLGYLLTPSLLVYGVAGITGNEFKIEALSYDKRGLALGGGIEVAISPHLALTAEYLQTRVDKFEIDGMALEPANHSMRLGVVYRFNELFGNR